MKNLKDYIAQLAHFTNNNTEMPYLALSTRFPQSKRMCLLQMRKHYPAHKILCEENEKMDDREKDKHLSSGQIDKWT